jgi:hypothetical protein
MMDGMGDIKGTLTPELFDLVSTVIDAEVNPTFLDGDGHTHASTKACGCSG